LYKLVIIASVLLYLMLMSLSVEVNPLGVAGESRGAFGSGRQNTTPDATTNNHIRPYPLKNSRSRPLSYRQASEGPTSSWVADDQRIPGAVCFCPFFASSLAPSRGSRGAEPLFALHVPEQHTPGQVPLLNHKQDVLPFTSPVGRSCTGGSGGRNLHQQTRHTTVTCANYSPHSNKQQAGSSPASSIGRA
jgi:hypothetical protein